jgi:hypothetical protein
MFKHLPTKPSTMFVEFLALTLILELRTLAIECIHFSLQVIRLDLIDFAFFYVLILVASYDSQQAII